MKVKDLIEKLASVDPEAEVGHSLENSGPLVDEVSAVFYVRQGDRAYVVLETSACADFALFEMAETDEVTDLL